MIEYALLFGLGFVTAALAGLLLAPAIHQRIVKFTEDRIMATVPISRQELQAQKDMVRAEMATAMARTGHDLKAERARSTTLSLRADQLALDASRLNGENADLKSTIAEMDIEAAELRSQLRKEEVRLDQLKEALAAAEHADRLKEGRIGELLFRIQRITQDLDNLRIDLATRETEAESLHARINALRDERETLRRDLNQATQRAKDAELKLAREENKAIRLEDRLNSEISGSVDKDTIIERRISEIGRLKERLKTANAEAREAARMLKTAGIKPQVAARVKVASIAADERRSSQADVAEVPLPAAEEAPAASPIYPEPMMSDASAQALSEDVRNQASAAAESLLNLKDDGHDQALREEIADIAAKMIAIVAQKEGRSSPVRSMIAGKAAESKNGRTSLAERATRVIRQDETI